jgi:uncharacterized protein
LTACYLDSSAWLKHYWDEKGTAQVHSLFAGDFVLGCSELGPVELTSAFARKRKSGEINAEVFARFQIDVQDDWAKFEKISWNESVADLALQLAATYALRGADSVHLASATRMALSLMDKNIRTVFVSSDQELNAAAKLVGFVVIDPQESGDPAGNTGD